MTDVKELSPQELVRLFIEVLQTDDEKVQHHIETLEKLVQRVDVAKGPHLVRLKLKALIKARDAYILRAGLPAANVQIADLPSKVGAVLEQALEHLQKADTQSHQYSDALGTAIEQIRAAQELVVLQNLSQDLIDRGTQMKEATEQFQSEMGHVSEMMSAYQQRIAALEQEVVTRTEESLTDTLTGSFNRRAFERNVPELLAQAQREQKPLSLCYIDLDHFKNINDSYGHQAGDDVLVNFTHLANHCVGHKQALYRLGGDEFCLVFFGLAPAQAREIARKICAAVAEKPYVYKDLKFNLSLSGGFAAMRPDESLAQLTKRADEQLYQAKDAGRGRICVAE